MPKWSEVLGLNVPAEDVDSKFVLQFQDGTAPSLME